MSVPLIRPELADGGALQNHDSTHTFHMCYCSLCTHRPTVERRRSSETTQSRSMGAERESNLNRNRVEVGLPAAAVLQQESVLSLVLDTVVVQEVRIAPFTTQELAEICSWGAHGTVPPRRACMPVAPIIYTFLPLVRVCFT